MNKEMFTAAMPFAYAISHIYANEKLPQSFKLSNA